MVDRRLRNLAQRVQPGEPRHVEVEQDQIGTNGRNDANRFLAARRLADQLEPGSHVGAVDLPNHVGRYGEQFTQARPEQALVVGDHHARRTGVRRHQAGGQRARSEPVTARGS